MSSSNKRISLGWVVAISIGIATSAATVFAGPVTNPDFSTGNQLDAAHMNNIKGAVNDNDTRINALIGNTQPGTLKTEVDKITPIINNTQTGTLKTLVDGHTNSITTINATDAAQQTDINNLKGGVPAATCTSSVAGDTMVRVGSICVDKYEASVSGGVARSVIGVLPKTGINYFDAADACAKAGKRLLTNAEWQMAAKGTPVAVTSGAGCNGSSALKNTDADPTCVSSYGVIDMVGNASEWVADIAFINSSDISDPTAVPGGQGVVRGADATDGTIANVWYMATGTSPVDTRLGNASDTFRGFRCAR
jgi:hypothetical protein